MQCKSFRNTIQTDNLSAYSQKVKQNTIVNAAVIHNSIKWTPYFIICNTHNKQPFYSPLDFARDNPGELVPEETLTHSHLSQSAVMPYLLPPSMTIHGILPVQFTCLTVFFHNLSLGFLWSTSWPGTLHFILHTFLHWLSSFHSTCPYQHNLSCCSTKIMCIHASVRACMHVCVHACVHVSKTIFKMSTLLMYLSTLNNTVHPFLCYCPISRHLPSRTAYIFCL